MIKFLKDNLGKDPELGRNEQERALLLFEKKIEHLKNLYILYFNGELKLPPEKEREGLEKEILKITRSESRSPRINMMIQNISSRFSLYNNMWMKKMNEFETGISIHPSRINSMSSANSLSNPESIVKVISLNLNDEKTFEKLYETYQELLPEDEIGNSDKDNLINSMKTKMIMDNMVTGNVELSIKEGKLKIKMKN